jgi:integrase
MLALLFGCGFRRSELVGLELDEIQMRQGHWAVVDLIGKGGHIRTVPIPEWVKAALDQWTVAARVSILRRMTCGEPARNCATVAGASWSRFNSCWGMHPFKQRTSIWAANKIWGIR